MKSHNKKPKSGKTLISEPSLQDFYFNRSVVLLAEHSEEDGSMGVIINKPINLKLKDASKDFPDIDYPLYLGGPVHSDRFYYLHTLGDKIPGAVKIMDGLFWGGEVQKLVELIKLNIVSQEQVRFFIGYSGWQPNQLNNELKEKSWIVTNSSLNTIMASRPEELWSNMLKKLGNDYAIWANYPADPILN